MTDENKELTPAEGTLSPVLCPIPRKRPRRDTEEEEEEEGETPKESRAPPVSVPAIATTALQGRRARLRGLPTVSFFIFSIELSSRKYFTK